MSLFTVNALCFPMANVTNKLEATGLYLTTGTSQVAPSYIAIEYETRLTTSIARR